MSSDWDDRSRYRRYQGDYRREGYGRDRPFTERASDEVKSWFGDDDAERRRRQDDPSRGRDQDYGYGGSQGRDRDWREDSRPHYGANWPGAAGWGTGGTGYGEYGSGYRDEGRRDEGRRDDSRRDRGGAYSGGGYGAQGTYGARDYRYGESYRGDDRGRDHSRQDDNRRDWADRAGDEVKSWFGDDDAERRRRQDAQRDRWADDHRGRGPKGYTRSDDRIREDVSDRLTDDSWVNASNVEITVSSGEVTLSGTVASRGEKRRAEDVAESVSGVNHVQNNLRVGSGSSGGSGLAPTATGGAIAPEYGQTRSDTSDTTKTRS